MADDLAAAQAVVETQVDASEPVDDGKETSKTIEQLLEDGAHALAMGKYAESVEHYAFAVEKLVEKHGELAVETVDALEAYGNALLKNAISQSAVLGGEAAKEQVAASDTTGPATASSSKAASAEPVTVNNINFHFGGDAPDDGEEEADGEEGDGDEEEPGEDTDDFETAWEVLDTARTILAKQESKERKLQLARVHSSMAEVATESGRPEDGVKEYETALSIQKALLPAYDRLVAQTHLFIALALELVPNNQFDAESQEAKLAEESFDKAIEHVQAAKEVLKQRELFLKGTEEGKGKGKEDEAAETTKTLTEKEKDELKDLAELQVELDDKITDLRAQIEDVKTKATAAAKEELSKPASHLPDNVSKEVHNLNNLVKKKPKKTGDAAATNGTGSEAEQPQANGKRKAEEDPTETVDKRTKVEEDQA